MTSQANTRWSKRLQGIFCAAILAAGLTSGAAYAQKLTTLVNFNGNDGTFPIANLVADQQGNLIGTTLAGGSNGNGVVFEVPKKGRGFATKATVLYNGDATSGENFASPMMVDAQGNLIGSAIYGGTSNQGTIFEIAKTSSGYAATPTVLVSFDGTNGAAPYGGVITDKSGNLFGTTSAGGTYGQGVVFEITKTSGGYASTPTVLAEFNGGNGSDAQASLVMDASGNLFGTTSQGGAGGIGSIFEVPKTADGYASGPTTLFNFDYANGANPAAALILDASGNLYGTAVGGGPFAEGVVFELPKTNTGYAATPTILVDFDSTNGGGPQGALLIDAHGNLFSTTSVGGALGRGTVFELPKTASGYSSTPTILVNFTGADGLNPESGLLADSNGKLVGTTQRGGTTNDGTVYEVTNSGFLPAVQFAGTPGAVDCSAVSDAALKQTYGTLASAAKKLGYKDETELKTAVSAWCAAQ